MSQMTEFYLINWLVPIIVTNFLSPTKESVSVSVSVIAFFNDCGPSLSEGRYRGAIRGHPKKCLKIILRLSRLPRVKRIFTKTENYFWASFQITWSIYIKVRNETLTMPYLPKISKLGINLFFFAKSNTILLFDMYQVFIFLQDHLHFFFTFMEQLFLDDPISDWKYLSLQSLPTQSTRRK